MARDLTICAVLSLSRTLTLTRNRDVSSLCSRRGRTIRPIVEPVRSFLAVPLWAFTSSLCPLPPPSHSNFPLLVHVVSRTRSKVQRRTHTILFAPPTSTLLKIAVLQCACSFAFSSSPLLFLLSSLELTAHLPSFCFLSLFTCMHACTHLLGWVSPYGSTLLVRTCGVAHPPRTFSRF